MIPQTAMIFLCKEALGSAVRLADALLPNSLSQYQEAAAVAGTDQSLVTCLKHRESDSICSHASLCWAA